VRRVAVVVSIHRVAEHDGTAVALSEARYVDDLGLEGDWRSRPDSDRQISLIEEEALAHAAAALGLSGVPSGASRRQVVVRGIALNDTVGKRLRVGPLLVSVEDLCHPCANMEKKIGSGARAALAGRGGIVGRVVRGGILRAGDPVAIVESEP
jgi:MOSC domain-containing protein YiiM